MLRCTQCSRPNPAGSSYCFFDGRCLGSAPTTVPVGRFASPFVFPSGRPCASFDELARACLDDWQAALHILRDGSLSAFFRRLGRPDLEAQAHRAASFPDPDAGLDQIGRAHV